MLSTPEVVRVRFYRQQFQYLKQRIHEICGLRHVLMEGRSIKLQGSDAMRNRNKQYTLAESTPNHLQITYNATLVNIVNDHQLWYSTFLHRSPSERTIDMDPPKNRSCRPGWGAGLRFTSSSHPRKPSSS